MNRSRRYLNLVTAIRDYNEQPGTTVARKPIFGGPFAGKFVIERAGELVFVVNTQHDVPVGYGGTTVDALASARQALNLASPSDLQDYYLTASSRRQSFIRRERVGRIPNIQSRRAEILKNTGGECYYCSKPLTLDGKWHVEHRIPRVLGGTDEDENLVASCVPCNLQKGAKTAGEFKAQVFSSANQPTELPHAD